MISLQLDAPLLMAPMVMVRAMAITRITGMAVCSAIHPNNIRTRSSTTR